MRSVEAVLLAGGKSSRMGRDKALLPFGGFGSLAEYQLRRLEPLFERVSISAKEAKFPFDAPLILDRNTEVSSPMVALEAILGSARAEGVFVLGVDLPFVSEGVVRALCDAFTAGDSPIVAARSSRGPEPLCAVYATSMLATIEEELQAGRHRLQGLFERSEVLEIFFAKEEIFANLNRPEEYEAARERGLL